MYSKFKFLFRYINKLAQYPLHFTFSYFFICLFGSLKSKIKYDIFRLPHYAFGIYEAAKRALKEGQKKITVIEFGVANGRGLLAMAKYAEKVKSSMNIEVSVIGFDSGGGMPKHEGYLDHPELYVQGDFPMQDPARLKKLLPDSARLIITDLNTEDWTQYITKDAPVGFISIDVDYYSSTINLLNRLHSIEADKLLSNSLFYLDDVCLDNHNPYQGELLAVTEFNEASALRKFDSYYARLRHRQKFCNEQWLEQMYQFHCLDHPQRNEAYRKADDEVRILGNKYLKR